MKWINQYWQDLQPIPGRLATSLRIVLATIIALILMMTWQVPASAYGLYIVFMVARDSPSISMRAGILTVLALCVAVATELAIVIATNNDPMFRVLTVPIIAFLAGMAMRATTISNLAVAWGFIVCTLIANWEFHTPAEVVVKNSMWLAGAGTIAISSSVLVEYMFGETNPVARLQEHFQTRYQALENLFTLIANGAPAEDVSSATIQVTRLAAAGQAPMQELYNVVVDRELDPGALPIGSRVRISMLAQFMDISAAFGSQHSALNDPQTAERCARIATACHQLASPEASIARHAELLPEPPSTLLDRIETMLHTMLWMPQNQPSPSAKELIALPSNKVPLLIPGGLKNQDNVAFALQLSLCATICYIFYHAVGWPGISTSVTTVFFTALGTTGATKQKLFLRILGAAIGGLVLGIGCTAFLFPLMDSITSLVVLVAAIAFIAAWCATGRRFSYVGMQIALAFYFVAFEGFGPPQELAPARDRFVGILVALVVMWFVFDQLWPVRTVTIMRRSLASVLRSDSNLLRLGEEKQQPQSEALRQSNALRDQVGKTVAALRSMDDAVEYEFGADREIQLHSSHAILRAAFIAVAIFWNQLVVLHGSEDEDFLREPKLMEMRRAFAAELMTMADVVAQKAPYRPAFASSYSDAAMLDHPRYGEYVRNTVNRFGELQEIVLNLSNEAAA